MGVGCAKGTGARTAGAHGEAGNAGRCSGRCRHCQGHTPRTTLTRALVELPLSDVLVVHARDEHAVHARNGRVEHGALEARVPERVDLPRGPGHHAKRVVDEPLAEVRVVDHVNKMRACFIMHAPSAVDELELPRRDELLHLRLLGRGLAHPPFLEKCLLHVNPLAVRVVQQRRDGRLDDAVDVRVLDRVVGAVEVCKHWVTRRGAAA